MTRRPVPVVLAAGLLVLAASCGTPPGLGAACALSPPAAVAEPVARPSGPVRPAVALPSARPVDLIVPVLGMRAGPVAALGLDAGGVLEMPADAVTAGWFSRGPTPGAAGPAVLTAHVAYGGRTGLFARLAEVAAGDEVSVLRDDGSEAVFTAYRTARFAPGAFPTSEVYGPTAGAELRLVTWGGVFDRGGGAHPDNVVVFARLAGVR